jgi:Lon protease-like protein
MFGVVLIRSGAETLGPLAEPYEVGCTARIVQSQPLEDGRYNLLAVGQERFRLLSTDRTKATYLVGIAEYYPVQVQTPEVLSPAYARLRSNVERYMSRLSEVGDIQTAMQELPEEGLPLLYLASILLQMPPALKQKYLEIESALDLAEALNQDYRKELALLGALLKNTPVIGSGGFSVN